MSEETTTTTEEQRSVGDMEQDEFFAAIGEGVKRGLESAGLNQPQGKPAVADLSRGDDEADEPKPLAGEALRAHFVFERSAEFRSLPNQQARDDRFRAYMVFHEWAKALYEGQRQRADKIVAEERGITVEAMRQTTTAPGSGGALVPTILEGPIIEKRDQRDKLTARAMPHRSASGVLDLAEEGSVRLVASGTAEVGPITTQAPTYDKPILRLKKATAAAEASREVIFDAAASMQLAQNFARQAGRAFGLYNNNQNVNGDGTGTNYTNGILDGIDVVTTGVVLNRAALLAMKYGDSSAGSGLSEPYREGAVWLANSTNVRRLSELETSGGQLLYPQVGSMQTIPGPLSGDAAMGGNAIVEGQELIEIEDVGDVIVLANLEFLHALLDGGIRVEVTTEGGDAFLNDTQIWKFVQRQDVTKSNNVAAFKASDAFTS